MTCRNYIPGPDGDCQRCGEMRAGHAGRDLAKELIEGAEEVKEYVRAGHAGSEPEMLDDGFGNQWPLCRADCALQIVRPGKVQCDADDCPHRTDNPSYYP